MYNKPKANLNLGVSYLADQKISDAKRLLKLRKRLQLRADKNTNNLINNPKHFINKLKMVQIGDANESIAETPRNIEEKNENVDKVNQIP